MSGFVNCFSVSFTYCLIYSGLSENRRLISFLTQFLFCVIAYICFMFLSIEQFFIFPFTLISSIAGKGKQHKYLYSFFRSLSAMLIFSFFVLIVGNLIFTLYPDFRLNRFYDFFMSAISVIFAVLVYFTLIKKNIFKYFYDNENIVKKSVVIESVFILIISFIHPLALATGNHIYIYISFCFMFSAAVAFYLYMAYSLTVSENKVKLIEQQRLYDEINNGIIEEKYKDIISLKHYYNKLYEMINGYIGKNDWLGLKDYYAKYISPLHENYIEQDSTVDYLMLIGSPLIKNLLSDTAFKAKHIYGIQFYLTIANAISSFVINEMDLFIILNEWISNAFDAVKDRNGYIQVFIAEDLDTLVLKVVNPIYEDVNISAINRYGFSTKPGHNGAGLANIEKVMSSYRNLEHMNYVEMEKFTQCLIIRKHSDE